MYHLVVLLLLYGVRTAVAIGQQSCVTFKPSSQAFSIVSDGRATPIFLSEDDWPGVQRAALDFASDIQAVTGVKPLLRNVTAKGTQNIPSAIIVGTLGKSSLIDQVVSHAKLNVSSIQGSWESFMAREVKNPLPGIGSAYVVIGSDKRGSIFALYDHSEQFGQSPWYWWADVPATKHSDISVLSSGCSHGTPVVKYRGIFLNDEQPALQNWAMKKFTNGTGAPLTGSPFNHLFYTKLFELILRLKGNYLWPGAAFAVDDPESQVLADWYGIVMGTSHEEPMMRSTPIEWNLFGQGAWNYTTNRQGVTEFWTVGAERAKNFENVFTLGMRVPLSPTMDIPGLEAVISGQRQILSSVFNTSDVTTIPQMWCLYKEVQGYYEAGMQVPDDVTLLWTDDNWGNIRRFPVISERNRTGGAGIYYHVDYVGDPRDYKWITSSQVTKIWEQMSLAVDRNATRIWMLNVGDLKPYEMSTEFFLALGWNSSIWNRDNIDSFVSAWAKREFDLSAADTREVTELIFNVTRFNARRKPELLNSTTYSLVNYREAESALDLLKNMSDASTRLYNSISSEKKAAFFQLVQHPIQATYTLANMWISAGINNLRASQARLSANNFANQTEALFDQDYDLEVEYHQLLNGKWDHMMDQTHVMYYYWQQPQANTLPLITKVQARKQALPGPMRVALENSLGAWPGDNPNDCALGYSCSTPVINFDRFVPLGNVFIDIGAGGPNSFTFSATTNASWLRLSSSKGSISPQNPEIRVFASVDWSQVPDIGYAQISLTANATNQPMESQAIIFIANHTSVPSNFTGFVEGDGGISIEAAHASRNTTVDGITWVELPNHGRISSAVTPFPRGGSEQNFTAGSGPSLEYDFFSFNTIAGGGNVTVTTLVSPTLNANGDDRPVGFAVSIDSGEPQTNYFIPSAIPGNLPDAWDGLDGFAANNIVFVNNTFPLAPGAHTLKIWMIEPTVIVQKIVIDTGGVRPSYLGPPESTRV
ncbi:hypothetical protein BC629DRAFT_1276143 [Irpex lacteus]|nr:hypothetical protein BC629DRAFT_1276143 [Irpex lacteus]